jgi:hypothetical protein
MISKALPQGSSTTRIRFTVEQAQGRGIAVTDVLEQQLESRQMPKANDLEGRQDMGGKHGGQAGKPVPEERSGAQHGIVKDEKGQEQPADKARAQQFSKTPAAGPHAKPELTDNSKTPGAGALPEPGKSDDSTSG